MVPGIFVANPIEANITNYAFLNYKFCQDNGTAVLSLLFGFLPNSDYSGRVLIYGLIYIKRQREQRWVVPGGVIDIKYNRTANFIIVSKLSTDYF